MSVTVRRQTMANILWNFPPILRLIVSSTMGSKIMCSGWVGLFSCWLVLHAYTKWIVIPDGNDIKLCRLKHTHIDNDMISTSPSNKRIISALGSFRVLWLIAEALYQKFNGSYAGPTRYRQIKQIIINKHGWQLSWIINARNCTYHSMCYSTRQYNIWRYLPLRYIAIEYSAIFAA